MAAAGVSALLKKTQRRAVRPGWRLGRWACSVLALMAFVQALAQPVDPGNQFPVDAVWNQWIELGWLLDPLAAVMLVMVTFVGLLIFIYSLGYMAHDENSRGSSVSSPCLRARCWAW